jgi:hypothetical protein
MQQLTCCRLFLCWCSLCCSSCTALKRSCSTSGTSRSSTPPCCCNSAIPLLPPLTVSLSAVSLAAISVLAVTAGDAGSAYTWSVCLLSSLADDNCCCCCCDCDRSGVSVVGDATAFSAGEPAKVRIAIVSSDCKSMQCYYHAVYSMLLCFLSTAAASVKQAKSTIDSMCRTRKTVQLYNCMPYNEPLNVSLIGNLALAVRKGVLLTYCEHRRCSASAS